MAHTLKLPIVRALGWFLRKVFRRIYQGIHVEEKGMETVKDLFFFLKFFFFNQKKIHLDS